MRFGKNKKLKLFHYSTYGTIHEPHCTIPTNFYIYLFSAISFQFQQNKWYLNRPLVNGYLGDYI